MPRAPMSEPWLMALHVDGMSSHAVELGHHRLEGERHVRARVAVGHRVDVEPVDDVLVGAERVAVTGDHGPQVVGAAVARASARRRMLTLLLSSPVSMASVCEVCGKHPSFGMRISHSHRRTKRRWNPNIQRVRALVNGSPKRVHVCTSCLKAGKIQKLAH